MLITPPRGNFHQRVYYYSIYFNFLKVLVGAVGSDSGSPSQVTETSPSPVDSAGASAPVPPGAIWAQTVASCVSGVAFRGVVDP